ncbi:hypothetical protein [Pleurocapsa sp. PCC 7319]|nr:hypothetical protein [Pleurocapsa sp. PCC 7319]
MPQTKVEKKFFRKRVAKNWQKFREIIVENLIFKGFQVLQKNIAGGVE